MASFLLTGFPGFLGTALLPRLLARHASGMAFCLVQPRWAELARKRVAELCARRPELEGRIQLVEGDITRPRAGLEPGVVSGAEEIFHLAAVYDLTVSRAVAEAVNVAGTRHVLKLARETPSLRRFHHVSTCYVSGTHDGVFHEDDLDVGQSFKNHYEETKFRSEVLVRSAMKDGVPATVYRPAVVVGNSTDGATQKLDGPYMFIRFIVRQGPVAVLPVVGDPYDLTVNIVPRDFLVDALSALSGLEASLGRTYHLAGADPASVGEMLDAIARAAGCRLFKPRLPMWMLRGALRRVPGMGRLTGIPAQAVDYYRHRSLYDVSHTLEDLEGTGISAPRFDSYVEALVRFVEEHPELGREAMV